MSLKRYRVTLTSDERQALDQRLRAGRASAPSLTRARVLLKADAGPDGPAWTDTEIADAFDLNVSTIARIRRRFVEHGIEHTLTRRKGKRVYQRKLDGEQEARLVAVACSEPPSGHKRWTLRLLANTLVELDVVETVSYETVRQTLKQTFSNRG